MTFSEVGQWVRVEIAAISGREVKSSQQTERSVSSSHYEEEMANPFSRSQWILLGLVMAV